MHEKCDLLDCFGSDEIIAKGRVMSKDPKELVHKIPLGPNAMKVLIELPRKLDAFLWRPTPNTIHIGEAMDMLVAWPVDRVILHSMDENDKDDNMVGKDFDEAYLWCIVIYFKFIALTVYILYEQNIDYYSYCTKYFRNTII